MTTSFRKVFWERLIGIADAKGFLAEVARLLVAGAAGLVGIYPFLRGGIMGGDDAKWYTSVVADNLVQWRSGSGPAFVGQTYYAAMGTVIPLRVAPYLQHLTLALDYLTGQTREPASLLNLAIAVSAVACGLSAYLCVRYVAPERRVESLLLSILYAWCPGVIGLSYTGQLFMSAMALPYLPLVFTGVVRIYRKGDLVGWAWVSLSCAAAWLGHSPIGFWASVAAALALCGRYLTGEGRTKTEALKIVFAGVLFLGLCGYVFVSTALLQSQPTQGVPLRTLLATVRVMVPGALLPVTKDAGELSDVQLGYGLWFVLLAGSVFAWRRPGLLGRSLFISAFILVCLTLPVPILDTLFWQALPQVVVDITNAAPMQRLYPILAACSVILAAVAISDERAITEGVRKRILAVLAICILWSGFELHAFVHRGSLIANTREHTREILSPENLTVTRYSMGLLSEYDRFFSNGFMDFELEQRILDQNMGSYLLTNVGAIAPGHDLGSSQPSKPLSEAIVGSSTPGDTRWVNLSPTFTLQSGHHYLLALDFIQGTYNGVLQLIGPGLFREYQLPHSGALLAFGTSQYSTRVIPLFSAASGPVEVTATFVNLDSSVDLSIYADFGRYQLIEYRPEDLPIHLKSMYPYVAEVKSPAKGWLETFRYFTPGWAATVNGQKVKVSRSRNDLVAVPIEAGSSEVKLSYQAPALLTGAYWLTWATWAALATYLFWQALRRDGVPSKG